MNLPSIALAVAALLGDVQAQSLVRTAPAGSPPPTIGARMAADIARGRLVLFGGIYDDPAPNPSSSGIASDDTWEWDGTNWSRLTLTPRPLARGYHSVAYDGTRVIVFGGWDLGASSPDLGDTWAFDGIGWTQLAPASSPSARSAAVMVHDTARNRIVLFGGADTNQQYDDTWEWDGVTWNQITTPTRPPARSQTQLVYDTTRGRVVMFGGVAANGTSFVMLQDTWEYDGASWTQVTSAGAPPGRALGAFDHDVVTGRSILYGGSDATFTNLSDTWAYDGTTWTAQSVANAIDLTDCAHAYDLLRQRIVYFGGGTNDPQASASPFGTSDLTLLVVPGTASAAYTAFGSGCAGQQGQVPTLAAAPLSLPVQGTTFAATIDYPPVAAPFAVMIMGFSNTSWAGGPLPFQLAAVGIGGNCSLLVDPLGTAVIGNGIDPAVFRLTVPVAPQLAGLTFHNQALVLDASAPNGLGALTNGCTATVQ